MKKYISPVSYNSSSGTRPLIPALVAAAEVGLAIAAAAAGVKAGKAITSAMFGNVKFNEDGFGSHNFKIEN